MANREHVLMLKHGISAWNLWRERHRSITPDLSGADLRGCFRPVRGEDTPYKIPRGEYFYVSIPERSRVGTDFGNANFRKVDFRGANLSGAFLAHADFTSALCMGANFQHAIAVQTRFSRADLTGARVYGIAAWDLELEKTVQRDLVITPNGNPLITVDDLEVAQFVHLLLSHKRIRNAIDTITSKVVLILGRFTPKRKSILDAIREELRLRNYLPVLFDFERPTNRDLTETVSTLAHMARFVIADITDAKSIPQELGRIVPFLPSVPVQPILLAAKQPWGMYDSFARYPWVLPIYQYESEQMLLANLKTAVVDRAERTAAKQIARRRQRKAKTG